MKKAWVFIIVFFVIIAALAGWAEYQRRQNQRALPAATPAPTPESVPPLPNVQNFPNVPPGTTFIYDGLQKSTPETLPTYQVGPDMTISSLNSLATRMSDGLGFTATPSAAVIKGSFVFVRNQDPLSFYLARNDSGVSLSYQRLLAANVPRSSVPTDKIASAFLGQLNISPAPYSLSPLGQQTNMGESIAIGDIPVPQLYKYGFGVSITNVPVLTTDHTLQWGIVVVDENGIVRLTKTTLPYPSPMPVGNSRLVSLQSALAGLAAGRGVLVSVSGPEQNYFDAVPPSFSRGVVSDFAIVYAKTGDRLVPAYRLVGSGQTQDGKTQSFEALVLASAQ